jgi:hypothetical protein
VIVRIATEGQYELEDDDKPAFDELDNDVVHTCETDDDEGFHSSFGQLLEFVRTRGKRLSGDQLVGSDVILPPPDVSLKEAKAEFTGEGLIPS